MDIREATPADWAQIYPFWAAIVAAGETYAYPEGLGPSEAESWWMEPPPARVVVAVDPPSAAVTEPAAAIAEPAEPAVQPASGPSAAAGGPAGGVSGAAAVGRDRVLGSAKMGPNRPGRGAHIATASFMVDPAARGRGVGRALGEYVIAEARRAGYHGIQFNAVVQTNAPAVRLWQSLGFRILATVPEAFDHRTNGLVGLHVMYLKL